MGFWKIMGGVAAGIGAVVALPVAGTVGTITIAGAAIAGTVGGIAGAVSSSKNKAEKESAYREGERIATAKYKKDVEKLNAALDDAKGKLKGDKAYFQLLIAMFAVGMATANADGSVCEAEMKDLEEFTAGIAHTNLPPHVKGIITRYKNNPPSFETAMNHVNKLECVNLQLFRSVIELVAQSDGRLDKKEAALLAVFEKAVA